MTRDEERAIKWDCQKVWRQYYHYVDQKEYEKAAQLFTPDVDWRSVVNLKGRDEIVQALYGALGDGTIRHVLTNMVVDVKGRDEIVQALYGAGGRLGDDASFSSMRTTRWREPTTPSTTPEVSRSRSGTTRSRSRDRTVSATVMSSSCEWRTVGIFRAGRRIKFSGTTRKNGSGWRSGARRKARWRLRLSLS